MSKLSQIYSAYVEEMKSTLKSSELLLQKEKNSLSGELKTSGKICEDFVKKILKTYIPNRLRLTSGYIIDFEKKHSDENLPQFDLLLVDNAIAPIYKFSGLDIEVVPVESVCGIFEIKRNIDKTNIKSFIDKLSKSVLSYKKLTKANPYNPGALNVSTLSPGIFEPLIGIVSLTSELGKDQSILKDPNVIDMIWSVDGFFALPVKKQISAGQITMHSSDIIARPKDDSYFNISKEMWSQYINDGKEYEFYHDIILDKNNPENVMIKVIGWLTYIFYRLQGRQGMDIAELVNTYYFL